MPGISVGVSLRCAGPELPSPFSVALPVSVVVLVVVTGPGLETLIWEEKRMSTLFHDRVR